MRFLLKIVFAPLLHSCRSDLALRADVKALRLGVRNHRYCPRYPRSGNSSARQRTNGIIVLVIAFSQALGLPMLAAWMIGQMQRFRYFVQDAIYDNQLLRKLSRSLI